MSTNDKWCCFRASVMGQDVLFWPVRQHAINMVWRLLLV